CQQREEMKSLRVEMIKQNLLTKLKMSAPPNITRPPLTENSAPILELMRRYAIDVEQGVTELDSEEEYVDSERVILPAKPPSSWVQTVTVSRSLAYCLRYFNFSEQQRSYSVHSAFLNFYVQPVNTTRTSALIQLQRYVRRPMSQFPPRAVGIRFIRISINNSSQGSYRKIRVTGLATGWLDRPSTNLGINIISTNIPNLIMTQSRNGVHNNPFLDVKLVQRARHRRRRSAAEGLRCDANSTETRCCRYDLDVDFVSVGWDWIIFPRNYNARYCAGECGYLQLSDTRKQLIRHLGNTAQMPATVKNCCVGKRMVPISMLYYDNEGNIIYSKVPDMEIIKCACL
uniref:TGF-beta family profile domain-containing protein n=1 Tax=Ciona savignyi TaxID=51511 RepID=H2YCS0_CIOSA